MAANLRIFLSSTCNDLFQERRDLARGLIESGHNVILSEIPQAMPVSPNLSCIENCLEAIRQHADMIVLIISSSYGSSDESGKSVTLKEYEEARRTGVPIVAFTRRRMLDLLPIYEKNKRGSFQPLVNDNRVFEFMRRIMNEASGNWLFAFEDADDVINTVKYQISCLLRNKLDEGIKRSVGDLYYKYTNNYTYMLTDDGTCFRTLEYQLQNNTSRDVERVHMGDTSDVDMDFVDMMLKIMGEDGKDIKWEVTLDTPRHKTWDVVFPHPLRPGQSVRYCCSWFSADLGSMETGQNRPAERGFIQYLFPGRFVNRIKGVWIRDIAGWIENPGGVIIRENGVAKTVFYHYRLISGRWRFRIEWE